MTQRDSQNQIDPSVIFSGEVTLGKNNRIHHHTIIIGPVEIGDDNEIGPFVCIGTPGQNTRDPHYCLDGKQVVIGSRNIIREFSAIQKPCFTNTTRLGNDTFLMQSVHIPHDAQIHDNVTITPMTVLAGSVELLTGVTLGIGTSIHQNSIIGHYAMVAQGAPVVKNIIPFAKYIPDLPLRVNEYAVKKYGFSEYEDEIVRYVTKGDQPSSEKIRAIIQDFEERHLSSGRKRY